MTDESKEEYARLVCQHCLNANIYQEPDQILPGWLLRIRQPLQTTNLTVLQSACTEEDTTQILQRTGNTVCTDIVKVMTIHRAKGLESPMVTVAGLISKGNREEEQLFPVGCTRATDRLTVVEQRACLLECR